MIGRVELNPLPIIVRRESEVGIAWEACVEELGLCALGKTPGQAADALGNAMRSRGLVRLVEVDKRKVNALVRLRSSS